MKINLQRAVVTGGVIFIALFAYEFLVHHILLRSTYESLAHLWRPKAEMGQYFKFMMIGNIFYAVFFAIIFAKGFEPKKAALGQGIRFGALIALFLSPANSLGWYAILPIPGSLAVSWLLACAGGNILSGIVAGFVYRP